VELLTIEQTATAPTTTDREQHFRYWSWWLAVYLAIWGIAEASLAHQPLTLLKHNSIFIVVGFFGAVLGNISAVGGGIVFIPVMIFVFHLGAVDALKIALASQAFGMTSGAIGWMQKKVVPIRALKLTVPGLLIGSAISSLLIHPRALLVKCLFGPVSILLGILTLVLSHHKLGPKPRQEIPANARGPLFIVSAIGGLITGWIAIGEGELVAATLMLGYGVNVTACIGLGVVLLSINSIFLTILHQFFLGGIPWSIAGFTSLGCVFGARLAPHLSRRSNPMALRIIFAIIAIGDGILFIVQYCLMHR
jgi:uncharacterized membrane protein YfcA